MQRPNISAESTARHEARDHSQKGWEPKRGQAEPCYKPILKELAYNSLRCQVPVGRGKRGSVTARQQHMYASENGYAVRNII